MAKDARHRNADTPARPSSTPKGHAEKSKVDHQAGRADKKQTTPDVTLPGKERDVKKRKNEIDDLFSTLEGKATKAVKAPAAKDVGEAGKEENSNNHNHNKKSKSTKLEGSKDDIFGTGAADGRKRTEEGYLIYSEDELGLGTSSKNVGYTKDCPFDCKCCF